MSDLAYTPGAMELEQGQIVGSWRVEAVLGRGAMAVVHRVRHTQLETLAALKVLDRTDPLTEQRLVEEGRAQGSLEHPGIVGVLDRIDVGEHAALVLEYVDGPDLAELLKQRTLPLPEALDLFRQIVSAVGAAHEAGLVHRDLKPSNVLVCERDGRWVAKVGDFGLVKSLRDDWTQTQAMLGTPRYMAPEQMRTSRRVDARADLFALGVILYELVCGQPPFSGDDLVQLYTAKAGGHYPDPRRLAQQLPDAVVLALRACLEGSASRRIASCDALLAILDGGAWAAAVGDETLDLASSLVLCPSCGALSAGERCDACGAPVTLGEHFRLLQLLSDGLHTQVWRAVDLRQGQEVVVRALREGAPDEVGVRFQRGARVARELEHPQIARGLCPPFTEHGRIWEIRELVEGVSLLEALASHRFSEAEVLEVIGGLCAPLAYLAERSPPVVHRAVGPDNVIRAEDGQLILIDLAQVRAEAGAGSLHDTPAGAPEQWVGDASPASDVYGLGSLAVHLLARRPIVQLRRGDQIAFAEHVVVGDDTRRLLAQMLHPDPAQRPSIAEVAAAVDPQQPVVPQQLEPQRVEGTWERLPSSLRLWIGLGLGAVLAQLVLLPGLGLGVGVGQLVIERILGSLAGDVAPQGELRAQRPAHVPTTLVPPLPEGPDSRRVIQPGADLAERPVPGSACSESIEATVALVGGGGQERFVQVPCAPQLLPLPSPLADGEQVSVPPGAEAWVPLSGPSGEPTTDAEPALALALSLRQVRVVHEDTGAPVRSGTIAEGWWDQLRPDHKTQVPQLEDLGSLDRRPWPGALPQLKIEDGVAHVPPSLKPGQLSVTLDGVVRRSRWSAERGVLTILPEASVSTIRVVEEFAPGTRDPVFVEGAGVSCGVVLKDKLSTDWRDNVWRVTSFSGPMGYTDAEGRITCDTLPADTRWAWVQAPGYVPTLSRIEPPETMVSLRRARSLVVGCAGLPEDRCTTLIKPPVCEGRGVRNPGICRFSGEVLHCECDPDAEWIRHGMLGSAVIPEEGDQVWLDLRGGGQLRGTAELPETSSESCSVTLRNEGGGLSVPLSGAPSELVPFEIPSLPRGTYRATLECSGRPMGRRDVVVGGGPSEVTLRSGDEVAFDPKASFFVDIEQSKREAAEASRELLEYRFPVVDEAPEQDSCNARVTISAEGRAEAVEVRKCLPQLIPLVEQAISGWRWVEAPEATTETLLVPIKQRAPEADTP